MRMLGSAHGRMIFLSILLLSVVVAFYLYLLLPVTRQINHVELQISQKKEEITQHQRKIEEYKNKAPLELFQLAQVREQIPEAPYLTLLLRDMRRLETVSGMEMSGYQFDLAYEQEGTGSSADSAELLLDSSLIPIRMTMMLRGSYEQVKTFLDAVHDSKRLIRVEHFQLETEGLSSPVNVNGEFDIICSVELVAYYAPELKPFFDEPIPIDVEEPEGRVNPLF